MGSPRESDSEEPKLELERRAREMGIAIAAGFLYRGE
jgi:hypothetical protein